MSHPVPFRGAFRRLGVPSLLPAFAAALLAGPVMEGADAVTVTVRKEKIAVETSVLGHAARSGKEAGTGWYPMRDPATKQPSFSVADETVEIVVLDNGLIEAWVCPSLGARLLRVIDKKTGTEAFALRKQPRSAGAAPELVLDDHLAWSPGGVKASFPFFEHGTHLRMPAGWRTVTAADGAVTVAMDLRFTGYQLPADIDRYGRYGDEILSVLVTVSPGSVAVDWTQRKDNPNATGRSDRNWNVVGYPNTVVKKNEAGKDKQGNPIVKQVPDFAAMNQLIEFLYPARWVVDHGPNNVHASPHWSARENWDVSHFAIDAPYRFAGGWYPKENVNRLRINDPTPGKGNGVKLWTHPTMPLFEVWGGDGWVFEYPGDLKPAYQPTGFSHQFWTAQGIGRATIANALVAAGCDGGTYRVTASRAGTAEVTDGSGKVIVSGPVSPHTVISGPGDGKRIVVKLDGAVVLDQVLPLDRPVSAKDEVVDPAAKAMFEHLKAGASPSEALFFERQCYGRNQGQPGLVNAWELLPKVDGKESPERLASLARVAWRLGRIDQAERIAKLAPAADRDLVLGLIASERGEDADFGSAGWQADYLRALRALRKGDNANAIRLARSYLAQVPQAWYPRLALAVWTKDTTTAAALAAENPASPEAQLVLRLLGQPDEADRLIAGRADAQEQTGIFLAQVKDGVFKPLPRFPVQILEKKGW